jgi:hypothetical protein
VFGDGGDGENSLVMLIQEGGRRRRFAREDRADSGGYRDYGQAEYGKNILVFGDGGDGENSPATLMQGGDGPSGGCHLLLLPEMATGSPMIYQAAN